jgi:hypothetical protein
VNGDTAAAVSGAASLSTTATASSAANYGFAFADGTLTITKAATTTILENTGGSLVATVTAVPPGAGSPTGSVQFLNGASVIGAAPATTSLMLSSSANPSTQWQAPQSLGLTVTGVPSYFVKLNPGNTSLYSVAVSRKIEIAIASPSLMPSIPSER